MTDPTDRAVLVNAHLPEPAAGHPEASWRLSTDERVWAAPGVVCVGPCGRPLVPRGKDPGPGQVRHEGRGLCPRCYVAARRAGVLSDYPRRTRTRADLLEDWGFLRATGCDRRQAAARIGVSLRTLERAIAG